MLTALDSPDAALDADEREFVALIREHGWFCTQVLGDDAGPGFSYTTGFWVGLGQPEVIVFGLDQTLAHDVLWDIYRDLAAGKPLPVEARTGEVFGGCDAWLRPMGRQHYRDYLGWSLWFYQGDEFPCLQLLWPDRAGRFPWEAGAEAAVRELQPGLGAM
jgi:hypothetical protein